MIVDVHTHTPTHRGAVPVAERREYDRWRPDRTVRTTNAWADYDEQVAAADVSIVFNIALPDPLAETGIPTDPARVNEATAEFAAADPVRRIGFLSVDPTAPRALEEAERCRVQLGLRGVKLGPNYQRFDPLHPGAFELYAWAQEHGLPILFHQGASPIREAPLRYAHPLTMDEIAIAHPELRIVMAHMGHPWQRDAIVTIRKHPHVYADVSGLAYRPWSFWEALRLASEWGAMGKLLLGSDFPIATTAETIAALRSVDDVVAGSGLPRVPAEEIEAIVHRDALAALGLAREAGA
ncbi:amidohydrolase family protein [Conexibacter woesei]|uniref:Amidohydrolase 2 n=1 Tax=Conexibacter woesei (strain DSM 14684 / CCUG 47730 / CIP 108061 / JCM 11494 / NBRC 100937 / ID131577) TaxID=469383 RepID=D3FDC1_CONWI|nr:amidohydrolase family protein [Conexibacter woesei]ADB53513.1 amidohydrolase 2 [Conexibacter woesei DSM 14684]